MDQVQDIKICLVSGDPIGLRVTDAAIRNIQDGINKFDDFLVIDDADGHKHFFAKKEILSITSTDERMGS